MRFIVSRFVLLPVGLVKKLVLLREQVVLLLVRFLPYGTRYSGSPDEQELVPTNLLSRFAVV